MKLPHIAALSTVALLCACGSNNGNQATTAATLSETGQGSADHGQSTSDTESQPGSARISSSAC